MSEPAKEPTLSDVAEKAANNLSHAKEIHISIFNLARKLDPTFEKKPDPNEEISELEKIPKAVIHQMGMAQDKLQRELEEIGVVHGHLEQWLGLPGMEPETKPERAIE